MSDRDIKSNSAQHDSSAIRRFLKRAILCLTGVTVAGLILGCILILSIGKLSGWSALFNRQDEQVEIYSKEQIDKFITSVLITVQNEPMAQEGARADMIFIASFNAFEQRLTMVALSDGMMLDTEEYGQKSIGDIYALGGPGLLVNTINASFELDLQNYACTDTHSLAAMIDLLGGIKTKLTSDEAEYINSALGANVKHGKVTLTGAESMVHAMDALSGDDPFGGQQRSLALVQDAVVNMRKTATKEAMLPLLSLIFSNIKTNLDFATLHDMGYEILKAEEIEYRSLVLPVKDSWDAFEVGSVQFTVDIPKNGEHLRETLYNVE